MWTPDPLDGGPPAGVLQALNDIYEARREREHTQANDRQLARMAADRQHRLRSVG